MWKKVNFGKYSGKTLHEIFFRDPDWFYWAHLERISRGNLADEADEVARKSRRVRLPIPKKNMKNWRAFFFFDPEGRFSHFKIVPAEQAVLTGLSRTVVSRFLDMSLIWNINTYYKLDYALFLKQFKVRGLGDGSIKVTAKRCKRFLETEKKF